MSEPISSDIEIAAFCRAVREPDPGLGLRAIAAGRAMVAFLEARNGLEQALAELYGAGRSATLMAPLQQATQDTWEQIDVGS